MTGFRRARALAPLLATALVALLALAGPATASNGSHGGWDDDEPTGTIASYDSESGVLTIDLSDGGSVSGIVTSRTWIDAGKKSCEDDGGGASRKAKQARKGGKAARTGDWGCHERRNGRHGHGEGRGWHHGWSHNHGDESDLVVGAVVEDAILILKDGKAFYAKVDLD